MVSFCKESIRICLSTKAVEMGMVQIVEVILSN